MKGSIILYTLFALLLLFGLSGVDGRRCIYGSKIFATY